MEVSLKYHKSITKACEGIIKGLQTTLEHSMNITWALNEQSRGID